MQRDPRDIIASVKRRNFGGSAEIRMLTHNADTLYTQLSLMSPDFFKCVQYDHLNTLSGIQKGLLANFLHPNVIPYVFNAMVGTLHYDNAKPTSPLDGHIHKIPGKH